MATYSTIRRAVRRASSTATHDPDAPVEPADERIVFDVDALAAIMRFTRTADGLNMVVAACEEEIRDACDFEGQLPAEEAVRRLRQAQAALRLSERVSSITTRHYREGPNGLERLD